jgi:hypothetical protein
VPGCELRDSGMSLMPSTTSTSMIGTLMRKTEPHQKCSSSTPPIRGPAAAPAVAIAPQTAMAVVRWRAWVNVVRMIDSVDGMRVAPATPSSAREAISVSAVGENAASAEAMPKPTAPISSRRLRPLRSPRLPIVTSRPASAKE